MNGSSAGILKDGILSCSFTKYQEVHPSNKQASKVANLTNKYFVFLGTGPVDSNGKIQQFDKHVVNLVHQKLLSWRCAGGGQNIAVQVSTARSRTAKPKPESKMLFHPVHFVFRQEGTAQDRSADVCHGDKFYHEDWRKRKRRKSQHGQSAWSRIAQQTKLMNFAPKTDRRKWLCSYCDRVCSTLNSMIRCCCRYFDDRSLGVMCGHRDSHCPLLEERRLFPHVQESVWRPVVVQGNFLKREQIKTSALFSPMSFLLWNIASLTAVQSLCLVSFRFISLWWSWHWCALFLDFS